MLLLLLPRPCRHQQPHQPAAAAAAVLAAPAAVVGVVVAVVAASNSQNPGGAIARRCRAYSAGHAKSDAIAMNPAQAV